VTAVVLSAQQQPNLSQHLQEPMYNQLDHPLLLRDQSESSVLVFS